MPFRRVTVCPIASLAIIGLWLCGRTVHAEPAATPAENADRSSPATAPGGSTGPTRPGPGETGREGFTGTPSSTEGLEDSAVPPVPALPAAVPAHAAAPRTAVTDIFNLEPADRLDAYGPRPPRVPTLTREQIVRYALENPLVRAADEQVEAMRAQLSLARFAWVPVVQASAVLSPGAYIKCDDISVVQESGETFDLQWCRSPKPGTGGTEANDLQTIGGYLAQLERAGISVQLAANFIAPVFTFGKLRAVRKLAEVGVALAGLAREQTRQETVLQVTEAHIGLLLTRESIKILNEAWDVVRDERKKIEQDLGTADDFDADPDEVNLDRDPDDLLQLEVGEIELAARMLEARKLESLALASLWALAGQAAPPGFDIAERRLTEDRIDGGLRPLPEYRELAMRHRPEAMQAEGLVRARKAQEKLARASFWPDLALVGGVAKGYGTREAGLDGRLPTIYSTRRLNTSSAALALALRWNFDFHRDAFALRQARAEHRRATHQREAARTMLSLAVEQAYRDLVEAGERVAFMALARDKTWQLVVSQQQKETVGGGDFGELRRALQSWAEYEFKHFEAIQAQNVAVAKLARAVGRPLVAP
ncbi:MAG: TolC family protein [Myxococcales bacterium FL481]|nr:MAG: TolC family protein [Myxococcales bacterium FL481]